MKEVKDLELGEKEKFILTAGKLAGVSKVELEALEDVFYGREKNNDFILRRMKPLFDLYEKNLAGKTGFIPTKDPYCYLMNADDVLISKKRLNKGSAIGDSWVITPNLEAYLAKDPIHYSVSSRYDELSEMNNLFLPYVAQSLGVKTAFFYRVLFQEPEGTGKYRHLSRNFLAIDETFISGNAVLKKGDGEHLLTGRDSHHISLGSLLEHTDKYVKKFCKKHGKSEGYTKEARFNIRQGVIMQSFLNKLLLNNNEDNRYWGLITDEENNITYAPMYNYTECGVVSTDTITPKRVVQKRKIIGGMDDIQSFMLAFRKEDWFRVWATEAVNSFDVEKCFEDFNSSRKFDLSEEYKEYYRTFLGKTFDLAKEVIEKDFDIDKFPRVQRGKAKIKRLERRIDDSIADEDLLR